MIFGPQLAKGTIDRTCEPSRGEAAARCGSVWNRKFSIQNSRFKIKRVYRTRLCMCVISGCSLRRTRIFGYELRASARRRLRPAAASYRSRKFRIQNSRFKIKRAFWARLGIYFRSGRSLRRTPATLWSCGPPPPQAAAHTVLTDRFRFRASPQPSGWACDVEEQPSAGGGRLRAAAASCEAANSEFKIQDSKSPIGLQPAEHAGSATSCGPPTSLRSQI